MTEAIKEKQILEMLEKEQAVSVESIMAQLRVSERHARELIKRLRQDGEKQGFSLVTWRNRGYVLKVNDQKRYQDYLSSLPGEAFEDVSSRQSRIPLILYFLFQQNDYISLQKIAELIDVSRSTILSDMAELKQILAAYGLNLASKAHYGIRIEGGEAEFRKAFYHFVVESPEYTAAAQDYTHFIRGVDMEGIRSLFQKPAEITSGAMESILDHIRVLIYRVCRENFIADLSLSQNKLVESYEAIASSIVGEIQRAYGVTLPETEKKYLAAQIAAKASVQDVPQEEKQQIRDKIHTILMEIDGLFQTSFSEDRELEEALLLHIYPMLVRISFNMELANPLVDMVSTQYANVFLIALRFSQSWEEKSGGGKGASGTLSRDEVGYLALHFATHLEQKKQLQLKRIKRILLITDERRSNLYLMKSKLEREFPSALVGTVHPSKVTETNLLEADLLLSTDPGQIPASDFKIIGVDLLSGDEGVYRLKEQILVSPTGVVKAGAFSLRQLFHPELFFRCDEEDYRTVLKEMSRRMEALEFAETGFSELVLKREERFTTVYENGIAGPHAMEHAAKINSIGVAVFPKAVLSGERKVAVMFLINVKRGHLFVHQEISSMLIRLMEQTERIKKLQKAVDFSEFMDGIQPLL